MKVLLDINIFMDALERRQGWVHSLEVINRARRQEIKGCISALTIPIVYLTHFQQKQIAVASPEEWLTLVAG